MPLPNTQPFVHPCTLFVLKHYEIIFYGSAAVGHTVALPKVRAARVQTRAPNVIADIGGGGDPSTDWCGTLQSYRVLPHVDFLPASWTNCRWSCEAESAMREGRGS